MTLYLASNSPRRYDILTELGLSPLVLEHRLHAESFPSHGHLSEAIIALSESKARSVGPHLPAIHAEGGEGDWVIAGDTVVIHSPTIPAQWSEVLIEDVDLFGKPVTPDDARRMLLALEARPHGVMSALSIWHPPSNVILSGVAVATVQLAPQSDVARNAYIASGSPFDKAGGYGFQDGLVAWFEGEESTILGLSKALFLQLSVRIGLGVPSI